MEITIILLLAGYAAIFFWLAVRHGTDSRDALRSKEQDLASYGVTWADLDPRPAVAPVGPRATTAGDRSATDRIAA